MAPEVRKIPGGFEVDGLPLRTGKCGCTSLAKCCYTWSKLRKKENGFGLDAKMSTPGTKDNFEWSYTVAKDGMTVKVRVQDARDKETYSGFIPPALDEWTSRGWEVIESAGAREDGVVYRCGNSRWLYKQGEQDVPFGQLPEDWKCPACGSTRDGFERIG